MRVTRTNAAEPAPGFRPSLQEAVRCYHLVRIDLVRAAIDVNRDEAADVLGTYARSNFTVVCGVTKTAEVVQCVARLAHGQREGWAT